jgi:hypothetical protein
MQDYDLTTPEGKQAFQRWITEVVRNEINSYVQQVLVNRNTIYVDNESDGSMTDAERIQRLEEAVFRR